MKFLILTVAVLGVAIAQEPVPQGRNNYKRDDRELNIDDRRTTTTPIPIIEWHKQQEHDGTYRAGYETGNNIIAEESGYIKSFGEGEDKSEALVQQGSYSYISPEGQLITVHYTADETGFHATGDHIPTPPPVSEEIQKGLDLIYAGIRQQQEAASQEIAEKERLNENQQIDKRIEGHTSYRQ
ncbi:endocuticle structural glycoprotein SgAbd-8 isoform X1 [Cephus cinctus]|uniref:Endocuticle structural glycoprotein SgAbd-8 isoform X1 n=1 Tax=Cephus cinctus TaxID=211228 RepID=A0AAJ7BXW1_CEPCN|nr:endocuticle structural glycoprotein SgAbd-8 isoform X1 [Cephus cinctus]